MFGTLSSPKGSKACLRRPQLHLPSGKTLSTGSNLFEVSQICNHPRAKAGRPALMRSLVASATSAVVAPNQVFQSVWADPREQRMGGEWWGAGQAGRGEGGKATDSRTNACNFITNLSVSVGGRLCLHSGPISLTEL
jgi:hypothetical protein